MAATVTPIEQRFQKLSARPRDRNALGVVAAVHGSIVWAATRQTSDGEPGLSRVTELTGAGLARNAQ